MLEDIKQIRRTLTQIELEAGTKHPEKPDYELMRMGAHMIQQRLDALVAQIVELSQ